MPLCGFYLTLRTCRIIWKGRAAVCKTWSLRSRMPRYAWRKWTNSVPGLRECSTTSSRSARMKPRRLEMWHTEVMRMYFSWEMLLNFVFGNWWQWYTCICGFTVVQSFWSKLIMVWCECDLRYQARCQNIGHLRLRFVYMKVVRVSIFKHIHHFNN